MIEFEDTAPEFLPGDRLFCPYCQTPKDHRGTVVKVHPTRRYLIVRFDGREFDELMNIEKAIRA